MWFWWTLIAIGSLLVVIVVYDLVQRKHAILRNFPIIGHFRYLLEMIGPELRQYIVTGNDEERPFSRDQRRWVYASAKQQNRYFGFGSDNEMETTDNYLILKHDAFPLHLPHVGELGYDPKYEIPCAKILGGYRRRAKAFRPASVVNLSAMSFGSLSGPAVEAINRGCLIAGCLHNSGEGGISRHHLHGADLIWQIGTGYFGCRDAAGKFDLGKLKETVARCPVRAIEIKLSQGAKAGVGGIVPAAKVTKEVSQIRGVPVGVDCLSPATHSAFDGPDSLLDFVERIAEETGLPVGIKSAVGQTGFWAELARLMASTSRAVDFISIDGGEGGSGAAPLAFSDHVALPFKVGFARVYRMLAEAGVQENIVFVGAAKLGLPDAAMFAFALGCDMIAVAREPMMAIGCIQAQRCHTGHCPTGVATQNRWLMRGLDPTDKAARLANYIVTLRKEIMMLSRTCGVIHPGLITGEHVEILNGRYGSSSISELFGYKDNALPGTSDRDAIEAEMKLRENR
ncbi:FMN-binding glutamate synthase family protein [Novipirellula artificiosorum]|uniref:Glutamate synthase [NADPH] large chain n=1 Tax=Novipirellula artificiosorum TaxID=2528016 RepID=A0A5C6DJC5_9BACT|nr:FMN-binding glutamate synthase family protein [Novipirellula artificiosorum]TWU35016.1 Glutamate synthase [NADPH] large chain [Novipirellula artificiosorum]